MVALHFVNLLIPAADSREHLQQQIPQVLLVYCVGGESC